jgi:hypothetical protein
VTASIALTNFVGHSDTERGLTYEVRDGAVAASRRRRGGAVAASRRRRDGAVAAR